MKKKGYKGRCEKRSLSKCVGICRTYDPIQSAYREYFEYTFPAGLNKTGEKHEKPGQKRATSLHFGRFDGAGHRVGAWEEE